MRNIDATPYRGKRVRFSAAVRAEVFGENRAQLWLRVDRPDLQMGFFDNMADRPITSPEWGRYQIEGDVADDAESIALGLMLINQGKAWLDSAAFEILGEATGEPQLIGNLGFENGELGWVPPGWFVPPTVQEKGYTARISSDGPQSGQRCAVLSSGETPEDPDSFGNLMRAIDAMPYRGKRVRFSAAVRAEVSGENRAQLWLRVDRPDLQMGFFDNMADRPITSPEWGRYQIEGDVADDAESIALGLMLINQGKAWLDSAAFEILGKAGVGNESPRALAGPARGNLVAFTRLLGYVR